MQLREVGKAGTNTKKGEHKLQVVTTRSHGHHVADEMYYEEGHPLDYLDHPPSQNWHLLELGPWIF